VLDFVGKESVDLLIIGMYKGMCKRKGLGRRGNATTVYNRRAGGGGLGGGLRPRGARRAAFSTGGCGRGAARS
jgi:hypothetical protein